jgi:hypothetical protein
METTRQEECPHLFSFAKNKAMPLSDAWNGSSDSIYNLFHLPLSTIAHEELTSLRENIHDQDLNDENDIWSPS